MASPALEGTAWSGRGLTRSVFTFPSNDFELYGSVYSTDAAPSFATIVCPSWGAEARAGEPLCRSLALKVAEGGGAAMVFDWPGQGESDGDPESVRLRDLIDSVTSAAREMRARTNGQLTLAGFRLGAALAALGSSDLELSAIALMQPVLDPQGHFVSVKRASARASLGNGSSNGLAFGFSFPSLSSFENSGERVVSTLQNFVGPVAAFAYGDGLSLELDGESTTFPGDWKQAAAARDLRLVDAAADWLVAKVGER